MSKRNVKPDSFTENPGPNDRENHEKKGVTCKINLDNNSRSITYSTVLFLPLRWIGRHTVIGSERDYSNWKNEISQKIVHAKLCDGMNPINSPGLEWSMKLEFNSIDLTSSDSNEKSQQRLSELLKFK